MPRTRKAKNSKNSSQVYSIHYPNKNEVSELEQEKRFEKLKRLWFALKSAGE
ncbi:MAG: hypothetical protein JWQ14_2764 [Adhaeribacter sp.]|nr:hypothetical protein [Adhaeribacter sp.]